MRMPVKGRPVGWNWTISMSFSGTPARIDHILVGQVVGALDSVEGVGVVAVVLAHHGRGAALGGHGVAAHRVDLRDHPDLQTWVGLGDGYGCPDACEPAADYQNVVAGLIHLRLIIFSGEN